MTTINDPFMHNADAEGDDATLSKLIDEMLASGKATPHQLQFLARLRDPRASTTFRLDLVKRTTESRDQLKSKRARLFRLWDLWSELEDKAQFVRLAAEAEDISETAVRKTWLPKIEVIAAEDDA